MANAPSNRRDGDGKEHHSYSDEYKDLDISSGRKIPVVLAMESMIRSEQLDLLEHTDSDDQLVSPTSIAQPMTSSSSEVEERYSAQSPSDPANKMKVAT